MNLGQKKLLKSSKRAEGRHTRSFQKNRAAHVDHRRTVRFNLEDGNMKLLTGRIIVGSCEEEIKHILFKAYKLGTENLQRLDISKQAYKLNISSYKRR